MTQGPISADGTVQTPAPEDINTPSEPQGPTPTDPTPEPAPDYAEQVAAYNPDVPA